MERNRPGDNFCPSRAYYPAEVQHRPDTELVVLAREGSTEAASVLFDRYWQLTWRSAYAVTASRELADDAAQEAIVKAFGALERFDETRPLAPWLKRIAVNAAIDLARRRRASELVGEKPSFHDWSLGEAAAEDVRAWVVADAVAALDPDKRLVVVLHYWLDLALDEVAGLLGAPLGTVASRLARAKAELRTVLEEEHVV